MAELTVVVVSYDCDTHLAGCLRSALAEPAVRRVVVVDNASNDSSVSLLREWASQEPRVLLIENTRNRGFAAACNQGLQLAQTEYVLLLNPDCVVRAGALAQVCAEMDRNPKVGMAGCMIRNGDGSEQRGCRRYSPTLSRVMARFSRVDRLHGSKRVVGYEQHLEPVPKAPIEVEAISGAFMCVRRTAVEQVGLLDEGYFMHSEDLDWCLRFRQAGWRILFVPHAIVVHDKGASSRRHLFSVHWHMHRSMARYYRKFLAPQSNAWINVLVMMGVLARYLMLLPLVPIRALRFWWLRRRKARRHAR